MMDMFSSMLPLFSTALAQAAEQTVSIHWSITVLLFIGMLVVLVFFHELGHFAAAMWMGIRVEEFGIGFPPRLVTLFERNGVQYTLNLVPLGGFVRFGGEDNTLYGTGSLAEATPWRKIFVMFAGPGMNLLLAILIFAVMFVVDGIPNTVGQRIGEVFVATPAAAAGFQEDDLLLKLNGEPVEDINAIRRIARQNEGEPIDALILRSDEPMVLTVTPGAWTAPTGEQREAGMGFAYSPEIETNPANLIQGAVAGVTYSAEILVAMVDSLGRMIGGLFGISEAPPGGVAGPVGIARATGEVVEAGGMIGFWRWMALISLNLFLLNLLPIPALDGSHIVFSLIEWLRGGKKVPPEKEALVHAIGFVSLISLIIVVSVSDVLNAINNVPVIGQ
jgi:regulator of sigma E protease